MLTGKDDVTRNLQGIPSRAILMSLFSASTGPVDQC